MANFIGIDLGTTFSAVAYLDETGRPQIIENEDGYNITPSVVSFHGPEGTETEVGENPRMQLGIDPDTAGRFKREMGTNKTYTLAGRELTPQMLSSLVLKKLKQIAEAKIGPVDEAVVTIPANFANEAREATLAAAKDAGLKVKYIINEPTAAALYYAFKNNEQMEGAYAVYDLGGGTFDVSIIRVSGNDVEVLSTEGISKLGGDDFDAELVKIVRSKFNEETGVDFEDQDYTKNDAEDNKKSLSRRDNTKIRVSCTKGKAVLQLTRAEFEESISKLIAQTEMLCQNAVLEAGLEINDIQQVFLVGGSTRVPCVREAVSRVFGQEPIAAANVDEVVALGAALYAAYKGDRTLLNPTQKQSVERVSVQERTAKCFGTLAATQSGGTIKQRNHIVIAKGEKIPCSASKSFYTMVDNQILVECEITESGCIEEDPTFCKIIWEGNLELPEGRPAGQEIKVTYSYDENQTMKCSFLDVSSGEVQEVDLQVGAGESPNEDLDIEDFIVE